VIGSSNFPNRYVYHGIELLSLKHCQASRDVDVCCVLILKLCYDLLLWRLMCHLMSVSSYIQDMIVPCKGVPATMFMLFGKDSRTHGSTPSPYTTDEGDVGDTCSPQVPLPELCVVINSELGTTQPPHYSTLTKWASKGQSKPLWEP
jgi:hypothetical protein